VFSNTVLLLGGILSIRDKGKGEGKVKGKVLPVLL
jgi:hypothetical protein